MSLLRLTFLGTSAAQPTLHRNLSGLAVKVDTDLLLFDCGEGSQRQMVRFGTGFTVDAVFFTHFHADHYLGIIGFLRTLGMMGREHAIHLYGPPPARRLLHQAVHLGLESMSFPIEIHEVKDGDVVPRNGYSVQVVGVDHRINALAYALVEDGRPGRFHLEKAKELGVPPGPSFGKLQKGEAVTLEDGRTVRPEDVLGPARAGRKLVISGDTRPCAAVVRAAKDADLLVHESTFSDDEQARALETHHSTAREAGRVAREAGVHRLVLTHLSSRHDTEPAKLLAQAREEYKGPLEVAYDGFTLELPLRD
ncbi:ribonuclease Z [Myxococcus stipitatus DSM 14675]|uniref:Ribonuclease Z n=1 Tax=Myxococcus stipitatus (strain DSM 14675 / JCM 12634 / Mx s8) TaxID=1278073 RepID=L7U2H8_MYXSD|nr:ribonuclease Z [Myxococcus stipitatus]AGC42015.1 ribonuclease Z [Myxococcus stipitatus DSM 14675]